MADRDGSKAGGFFYWALGDFFFRFFSKLFFTSFFKGFFLDFGGALESQMGPQTSYGGVFYNVFFEGVLESIFSLFFCFFQRSNLDFCAHRRCFVRIFNKSMFLKTTSKRLDLG